MSDEPRIAITTGEDILVSRWKKHWLYGEKLKTNGQRERGWFPRRVAVQVFVPKLNTTQEINENFYKNNFSDKKVE